MTEMQFAPAIDSPLVIVTCAVGNRYAGCLVGFSTQCSIDPPRFLVCLSEANSTFQLAEKASVLAVHLLGVQDRRIAKLFGEVSGDEADKFAAAPWRIGDHGAPVLTSVSAYFEGAILDKVPLGDHIGFLLAPLDPVDAASSVVERQLLLRDAVGLHAGHEIA
jgi:flavin reductase (DIM6/NTAB) family NADH-FMN oxidoreductase RutF